VRHIVTPLVLLASTLLSVSCGDGIDERYGVGEEPSSTAAATTTSTTVATPYGRFTLDSPPMTIENSDAVYSGAHSVVQLADGGYLLSGFDNHSSVQQPERGAIWHSDDLETWERVGTEISDADNQQTIITMVTTDEGVIAFGTDYSRNSDGTLADGFDATAWFSDDNGATFESTVIERDARLAGADRLGDDLFAWGIRTLDDAFVAALWRSSDDGASWELLATDAPPTPGTAAVPISTIGTLLRWEDSLIAIGSTVASDPYGSPGTEAFDVYGLHEASEAVDIGIWYSDDEGISWQPATPSGLSGLPDAQWVLDAEVVGDQLVLLATTAAAPAAAETSAAQFQTSAFTCDFALQRCVRTVVLDGTYDFIAATMVLADGVLIGTTQAGTGTTYNSQLFVFDPATGQVSVTNPGDSISQIETLLVQGDTLFLFGRNERTNLVQVAHAPYPPR